MPSFFNAICYIFKTFNAMSIWEFVDKISGISSGHEPVAPIMSCLYYNFNEFDYFLYNLLLCHKKCLVFYCVCLNIYQRKYTYANVHKINEFQYTLTNFYTRLKTPTQMENIQAIQRERMIHTKVFIIAKFNLFIFTTYLII